jgi:hypothetical protein
MSHTQHHMDGHSLLAYARLKPEALRAQITDILSLGIARTARELATMTGADLVSVRARLSDGTNGPAPIFRKAVRVEEEGSACRVWAFGLAQVPAAEESVSADASIRAFAWREQSLAGTYWGVVAKTRLDPSEKYNCTIVMDGNTDKPGQVNT